MPIVGLMTIWVKYESGMDVNLYEKTKRGKPKNLPPSCVIPLGFKPKTFRTGI